MVKIYRCVALASLLIASVLFSQSLSLTAKVNRQSVPMYQPFQYEVTISGEQLKGLPDLQLPNLGSIFRIASQSEMTSISLVNGQMSSVLTKQYTLIPQQKGTFTIPPSSMVVEGQTVQTNPIMIQVTSASAQVQTRPSPRQVAPRDIAPVRTAIPLFLESSTDTQRIYEGQHVQYTLTLFRRVQLWDNVALEQSELKDAYVETLPRAQEKVIRKDNIRYYAAELIKQYVSPLKSGVYVIPSHKVGVVTDPFRGQQVLVSDPVTLNILPLPQADKPDIFSGLVGQFTLAMTPPERKEVTQNQTLSLQLSVEGQGALNRLSDLVVPQAQGFKVYKAGAKEEQLDNGTFRKHFDYVVIPKQQGTLAFPGFELNYFDPINQRYVRHKTDAFELTIFPDPQAELDTVQEQPAQVVTQELRYLKTGPLSPVTAHPLKSWVIWLLLVLNLTVLGGIIWRRLTQKRENSVTFSLQKGREKMALIAKQNVISEADLAQVQQGLLDGLSAKFGMSFHPLSLTDIQKELRTRRMPDKAIEVLQACMEGLSFSAYAPSGSGGSDAKETVKKAIKFMTYLEQWEGPA